ncbi:hypothetical protein ACNYMP_08120 [Ligilactobacillus salivarius]|jgi:hypothetical protein|uniref:hypothetical protein n=1 Tax=Ligilactobacillus salivarius TaxID=1624 RepID=UPI003AB84479
MLLNAYIARGIMTICLIYITLSYTFVMFNDKDNYENSKDIVGVIGVIVVSVAFLLLFLGK